MQKNPYCPDILFEEGKDGLWHVRASHAAKQDNEEVNYV